MKKRKAVVAALTAALLAIFISGCRTIETEIIIDAPVEIVWREFISLEDYSLWNPFIVEIKTDGPGLPTEGEKIQVTLKPEGGNPMTFKPRVLVSQPYTLVWRGRVLIPGLLDGKHSFILVQLDNRTTKFIQTERFSGLFVPFVPLAKTEEGFNNMNRALKQRIESLAE